MRHDADPSLNGHTNSKSPISGETRSFKSFQELEGSFSLRGTVPTSLTNTVYEARRAQRLGTAQYPAAAKIVDVGISEGVQAVIDAVGAAKEEGTRRTPKKHSADVF